MAASSRPNLMIFMTDQQRVDTLGAFGAAHASTPSYDALAARGARFTQAFGQHSACSQSRIAMMTGWYPHVAGHRTLDHLLRPWEPNVLATLRAAGYHVAWAGVRGDTFAPGGTAAATDFFGFRTRPDLRAIAAGHAEGFPEGHRLRGSFLIGRIDDGIDLDEAAVRTAVELLAEGLPEPFVLVLTLTAPHPPFAVAEPWYSLHDRASMPAPAPIGTGKPGFMAELRARAGLDALTPDDWAEIAAVYHGMMSRVDDQLGRVLAALDRAGVGERTVTVCCTDHGEYLGDYGLVEKWPSGLDDCLVRNPLIVAGPGVREGSEIEALVEMIDLVPTLCELADTEVGHVQFGRSLVPLLAGRTDQHRERAFSEGGFRVDEEAQNEHADRHPYAIKAGLQHERPDLVGRAVAMRTPQWTYVRRTCEGDELYDRVADPRETTNLIDQADASLVGSLRDEVLDWLVDTSDVVPLARDPRFEPAIVEQIMGSS